MQDAPIDDAVHVEDVETVSYVYRLLREEACSSAAPAVSM